MLTSADFLTRPYTPDMTLAGIRYACQSLPYTYNRMGGNRVKRLRRIVAGKGVELAFKRYLNKKHIPHDILGETPFTDPDQYDIAIGGRRCDIKSFLLTGKKRISKVRHHPEKLLSALALVPVDQIERKQHSDDDIYIFAFFNALLTSSQDKLKKAIAANQPIYLIHALPKAWANPRQWQPLGKLALKSNHASDIKIEIGGQDAQRRFQSEQIILPPKTRRTAQREFCTLSYMHSFSLPNGEIGLHSPALRDTVLAAPSDWGNIWVYGMEVTFTGFITRREFRQIAERIPKGSRVFQYSRTRTENFGMPVRGLHPLKDLFTRAREWAAAKA